METVLVQPKNKEELEVVKKFLQQRQIKMEVVDKKAKQRRKEGFLDSLPGRLQEVERAERGEIKLKNAYDLLDEL